MNNRIAPVDGLRAFAVLGVMWAHTWLFYGNVALTVRGINIHRYMAVVGMGVDLFFVISGFCMYLMYAKKAVHFNLSVYGQFLLKRWKRIAPAFYVFIVIDSAWYFFNKGVFPAGSVLAHLFFVNTFISNNVLSPHYWSLSTEWQFYLVLPFIFINDQTGKKLWPRLLVLAIGCFCCRLLFFHQHNSDILARVTLMEDKIWYRFTEFGWGIMAARLYMNGWKLPAVLKGAAGFILGFVIAYIGRLMMVIEIVSAFGAYAFIVRALSNLVLTGGFVLILLNVINSNSIFTRLLMMPPFQFLGRISYSMYLCHWMVCLGVSKWLISRTGAGALSMNAAFLLSVLAAAPLAWLSYTLFEAPYFKKSAGRPAVLNNL